MPPNRIPLHRPLQKAVAILGVMLVCFLMQCPTVFRVEFTGEDEALFMRMSFVFRRYLEGDSEALRMLTGFYYPPLQWLLPYPLLMRVGPMEWALRLPGAIAASLGAGIWWWIARREGLSVLSLGLMAILLSASGIIANHAYALTCGLFAGAAAVMALGLYLWTTHPPLVTKLSSWWMVAAGWILAAMSLPDAFFFLPVLAFISWQKRFREHRFQALGGWLLITLWSVIYFWGSYVWPRKLGVQEPGVALKLESLISKIGTFQVVELVKSYAAASSWPAVICALLLVPWGASRLSFAGKCAVSVFAAPLALWTFVFGYGNVRSAHFLLAYPAYALCLAKGTDLLFEHAKARGRRWFFLAALAVVGSVGLSVVQAAWFHLTSHPVRGKIFSAVFEQSTFPQGRRYRVWGQSAAGWWIQRNDRRHSAVMSNVGGAFGFLYARRPVRGVSDLPMYVLDPQKAVEDNVRYYAHAKEGPVARCNLDGVPAAVIVTHRGQEVLKLYDLWRTSNQTEYLDATEGRKLYEQRVRMMWQRHRAGI